MEKVTAKTKFNQEYLGDSVYIYQNMFGQLVLTTENGLPTDPSNIIYLEPEVAARLCAYMRRVYSEEFQNSGCSREED